MANNPLLCAASIATLSGYKHTSTTSTHLARAARLLFKTQARWKATTPSNSFSQTRNQHHGAHRNFATHSSLPTQYQATVIGAGPAGITVVGNLLERNVKPILWVDDQFNGGRVNASYREVPSNTKVKLFREYATSTARFRQIVGAEPSDQKQASSNDPPILEGLDPEKGCDLSHAGDMLLTLTRGLKKTDGIDTQQGRITDAILDGKNQTWHLRLQSHDEEVQNVTSARLVLCTGSSPNNSPLPIHMPEIQNIDLDLALTPSKLAEHLASIKGGQIAVIGASHSAVLILRNLYNLAKAGVADIKVKWFTRHDLRYAEFMDGWILRDNTGLKGEAATWAKENLEPETLPKGDVSNYITKVAYKAGDEKKVFAKELQGVDHYVQAIGFSKDPTPALSTTDGRKLEPSFDHEAGTFTIDKSGERLPGLFGAGIAWPERVKDPHGNVEYAVGFFKFMKFVKRVSPSWN